ncbi:LysM repeat protein [Peribacillus deserti]|uniref:LysM repeat protein n=1 Tax=Peribacillus deserti TaxID=673318 RepID=A0ABS2QGA9_9BACI|nr:LysM peptidoglycan-binding domain-containing protein [Peribacillus deserti]MBM7692127.1 LysM repeat protein [Peribacillus deserti]
MIGSTRNNLEAAIIHRPLQKLNIKVTLLASSFLLGVMLLVGGTQAAACSDTYTIKKGDTLAKLSAKYHVTVQQLKDANGLSSDKIKAGQLIEVPASHTNNLVKAKTVNVPQSKGKGQAYVVKAGDTLWSISKKFNVTVDTIKQANQKKNNKLRKGEKLIIPSDAPKSKSAKVTGAADNHSIEFVSGKDYFVLQVGYGKAEDLVKKMAGKTVKVYYKDSQFISYTY